MTAFVGFALVVCFTTTSVLGKLPAPGGPQSLPVEPVDVLKAISKFQHLVSITDANNDTIFECMRAERTAFDPEAGTLSYVWTLPSTGQEIPFYAKVGETPGYITATVAGDPTEMEGVIYYTDYENCLVADLEYLGHQCSLWTQVEYKDAVPQDCIDHFVDTCGVIAPPHSRDLCPDGEGDY